MQSSSLAFTADWTIEIWMWILGEMLEIELPSSPHLSPYPFPSSPLSHLIIRKMGKIESGRDDFIVVGAGQFHFNFPSTDLPHLTFPDHTAGRSEFMVLWFTRVKIKMRKCSNVITKWVDGNGFDIYAHEPALRANSHYGPENSPKWRALRNIKSLHSRERMGGLLNIPHLSSLVFVFLEKIKKRELNIYHNHGTRRDSLSLGLHARLGEDRVKCRTFPLDFVFSGHQLECLFPCRTHISHITTFTSQMLM